MIVLYVNSESRAELESIGKHLLKHRLAIDVSIVEGINRLKLEGDELTEYQRFLLTAKTKALLFPQIDNDIREMCPDCMPEVYSSPIIHIDWDEANRLTKSTASI